MTSSSALRQARHSVSRLHVHLVFVTKYRRRIFNAAILEAMKAIFTRTCQQLGAVLAEFDGEQDHVHLLLDYPPSISVAWLANALKGTASRRLRQEHPALRRSCRSALWSPSYFAVSCGGAPLEVIKRYIQQQRTPA